jgi:hypothetical protein
VGFLSFLGTSMDDELTVRPDRIPRRERTAGTGERAVENAAGMESANGALPTPAWTTRVPGAG